MRLWDKSKITVKNLIYFTYRYHFAIFASFAVYDFCSRKVGH